MNNKIIILGAAESGVGAAILAQKQGFEVFVSDNGKIKDEYRKVLIDKKIPFEEGAHDEVEKQINKSTNQQINIEIIKSPVIPDKVPLLVKAREKGISVISEIEFAGRYTNAKKICITGSNGKTTTTMLTYHILKNAGLNVGLAGNVGKSFALQVAEEAPLNPPSGGDFAGSTSATPPREGGRGGVDYYVLELSSFQLDGMYDFKADIAIITNITPDHLDRYDYNFQNYINSKFRILQNQTSDDYFIFWNGDKVIQTEIAKREIKAKMLPFGLEQRTKNKEQRQNAAFTEGELLKFLDIKNFKQQTTNNEQQTNNQINKSTNQQIFMEMLLEKVAIQGTHNLYNSMAAGLAAQVVNIQNEKIRRSLENFTGVEHRMEYAASVRGVRYINDSKATNVNSTWYALQSMQTPVVLILGGTDKGNDYTEIAQLVQEKVRHLIFLGIDNEKLKEFFASPTQTLPSGEDLKSPRGGFRGLPFTEVRSMKDAVNAAYEIAKHGDSVLLSPCCASFDLFKNYEDRGRQFKECVRKL